MSPFLCKCIIQTTLQKSSGQCSSTFRTFGRWKSTCSLVLSQWLGNRWGR